MSGYTERRETFFSQSEFELCSNTTLLTEFENPGYHVICLLAESGGSPARDWTAAGYWPPSAGLPLEPRLPLQRSRPDFRGGRRRAVQVCPGGLCKAEGGLGGGTKVGTTNVIKQDKGIE